jgi:sterol carrier protein 2
MSGERVFVIGNGMTRFIKPGKEENPDYHMMAKQAIERALLDANISYDKVE